MIWPNPQAEKHLPYIVALEIICSDLAQRLLPGNWLLSSWLQWRLEAAFKAEVREIAKMVLDWGVAETPSVLGWEEGNCLDPPSRELLADCFSPDYHLLFSKTHYVLDTRLSYWNFKFYFKPLQNWMIRNIINFIVKSPKDDKEFILSQMQQISNWCLELSHLFKMSPPETYFIIYLYVCAYICVSVYVCRTT